ncbi:MAG: GNAT family N-acetyltransferase [Nanohaloarchaea archaeon]|nr:GNAT family N-acetyltransferase [Candidatus Nanohaloarchaea archaeon]
MERDGVVFRPVEEEDKEFLRKLINHENVRDTIGMAPKPKNLKDEEEHVELASEQDDAAYFLIEYEGEKVGTISLENINRDYRRCHLGLSIHPDYHGQGIGTTSVQMITDYAFKDLNMHKVRGGYLEHNPASKRIMEKAGFQEEGIEREFKLVDGGWKDVIWMSILEQEWRE